MISLSGRDAHDSCISMTALARVSSGDDRVLTRPIDLAAYASDASVYRLVPAAVVRPRSVEQVVGLFALCRTAPRADDLPGGRHQPVGPGRDRRPARGPVARLAGRRGPRRRPPGARRARGRRRGGQRPPEAVARQDRPGPGVDPGGDDGRHPREQLERHVLRRRAERLPHARVARVRAALGHGASTPPRRTPTSALRRAEPALADGLLALRRDDPGPARRGRRGSGAST